VWHLSHNDSTSNNKKGRQWGYYRVLKGRKEESGTEQEAAKLALSQNRKHRKKHI
jgi:hypothetical protein